MRSGILVNDCVITSSPEMKHETKNQLLKRRLKRIFDWWLFFSFKSHVGDAPFMGRHATQSLVVDLAIDKVIALTLPSTPCRDRGISHPLDTAWREYTFGFAWCLLRCARRGKRRDPACNCLVDQAT